MRKADCSQMSNTHVSLLISILHQAKLNRAKVFLFHGLLETSWLGGRAACRRELLTKLHGSLPFLFQFTIVEFIFSSSCETRATKTMPAGSRLTHAIESPVCTRNTSSTNHSSFVHLPDAQLNACMTLLLNYYAGTTAVSFC